MATYLQGVTDYIPQFQPFQPDLNFYANALQTKQNQYDTNYKALNNLYGQYFYSDLTHGQNIKKKDELMKAIDFNLKRVSGLDLSLEQNVDQATQVFKPFYEDKHLMKDMAWTKNTNSQRNYGLSLKNNKDEKLRSQYWSEGIREIDYKTEEFKNASLDETMNIGNVSYTPYINIVEKAQKIAKDAGFDEVESVDMTPDGRFMVKTKGGLNVVEDLSKLLEAQFTSDPGIVDIYRTKAYLNRKDNMYQNASKYGDNLELAERAYLTEQYKTISEYSKNRYENNKEENNVINNKEKAVVKNIESSNANIHTNDYLELIKKNKEVSNSLLNDSESLNNEVNNTNINNLSISSNNNDPFSDIETLRQKVDIGTASMLLSRDIFESAYGFAKSHVKVDYEANPFAVQRDAHMYRVDEQNRATIARRQESDLKFQRDVYLKGLEIDLANGKKITDANGEIIDNPLLYGGQEEFLNQTGAGVSDPRSGIIENREQRREWATEYVAPWLTSTLDMLHNEYVSGNISKAKISAILNGTSEEYEKKKSNKDLMSTMKFKAEYEKNPAAFLKKYGNDKLIKLQSAIDGYIKSENGSNRQSLKDYYVSTYFPKSGESISDNDKFQSYVTSLKNINNVDQQNIAIIKKDLKGAISVGNPKLNEKLADAILKGADLVSKEQFLKNTKGLIKDLPKRDKYFDIPFTHEAYGNMYNRDISQYKNNLSKNEFAELKRRLAQSKKEDIKNGYRNNTQISNSNNVIRFYIDELNDPASEIENIYDNLAKAYVGIASGNNIKRYDVVGGTNTGAGGKAGKYSVKVMSYEVMPKVAGAYGNSLFNQTLSDINRNFDPSRQGTFTATFGGITKGAIDGSVENGNTKRIKEVLNQIKLNKGYKNFKIQHATIAGENSNKSAMIFKVSADDLAPYVKSGLISESEYKSAMIYGLSFIAPTNTWQNSAVKDAKIGPIEGIINSQGYYEGSIVDDPKLNYKIVPDKDMPGNYTIFTNTRRLMPDGTWSYTKDYAPALQLGGDVNLIPGQLNADLQKFADVNNAVYNTLNK